MKKIKKLFIVNIILLSIIITTLSPIALASESNTRARKGYKIETEGEASEYGYQSFKIVDEKGNDVNLENKKEVPNVKYTNFPSSYDSREVLNSSGKSIITSVKNQDTSGCCWAFAAISSLETSLLRKNIENNPDYSESHLAWFGNNPQTTDETHGTYGDGVNETDPYHVGGNYFTSGATLAKWSGTEFEEYAPFDTEYYLAEYDETERFISEAHLEDFILIDSTSMSDIKSAIMNYGGVTASYFHDDYYYNCDTYSYYQPNGYYYGNHAIYIVGWDDNYSISNFVSNPGSKGAWLVKNSWGKYWGNDGYFWISYVDPSVSDMAVFEANNNDIYNNIYQYDGYWDNSITGWFFPSQNAVSSNIFTTKKDETLQAVGIMTASDVTISNKGCSYKIDIYKNVSNSNPESGVKVGSQTGIISIDGFETIELATPISLVAGTRFSIVLTVYKNTDNPNPYFFSESTDETNSRKNESFYYDPYSNEWIDCYDTDDDSVYIKAYTTTDEVDTLELQKLTYEAMQVLPETTTELVIAKNILANYNSSDSDVQNAVRRLNSLVKVPTVKYATHVQRFGWQNFVKNGEISGTSGLGLRLEAIQIKLDTPYKNSSIEYSTHIQGIGWQDFVKNGELSGTSGMGKRLEAIKIKITGDITKYYDIYYRVHAQKYGWLGWAKNGEIAGTAGQAKRLEAIEIRLVRKNETPPTSDKKPYVHYYVGYHTHVQNIGWQDFVYDGVMAGTTGMGLRLEGIEIKLKNQEYEGNIEYRTHIQKYGWENVWKKNGEMSGTSGEAKRLEAIQIKLTDEMSEKYDIYYRVHAQKFGWLGWAKNGESAGTAGYGYRLEGIEIIMVDKGEEPPEGAEEAFKEKAKVN